MKSVDVQSLMREQLSGIPESLAGWKEGRSNKEDVEDARQYVESVFRMQARLAKLENTREGKA